MKYSNNVRVGGIYSKGDRSTRFRVSKYRDRGEELLGEDEGGVELRSPQERLTGALEGVGKRSKDLGSVSEKSPVEINYTKKTLKSWFIRGSRELCDGRGMLGERMETGTGEMVSQELSLRHRKFTFAQADRQAMGSAQVQDILEIDKSGLNTRILSI